MLLHLTNVNERLLATNEDHLEVIDECLLTVKQR